MRQMRSIELGIPYHQDTEMDNEMIKWIKQNIFNLTTILIAVIGVYIAANNRIIILEERVQAQENRDKEIILLIQNIRIQDLKEIKEDLRNIENKLDRHLLN